MKVRTLTFLLLGIFLLASSGCATYTNLVFQGGERVDADYQPAEILVSYRAEGDVPNNIKYFLVNTGETEAMYEKYESGASYLFTAYRETERGDHFSGWVVGQPGFEFVIPKDRSKPALKYAYPVNKYRALKGSMAVVPKGEFEPVARLIPE